MERIGFRGVRRRVLIESPLGPIHLDLEMNLTVSIGADRRGAHLSRNIEALRDALEDGSTAGSIEEYLDRIAMRLLERHGYAVEATVEASTRYYVSLEFNGIKGEEPVDVEVSVSRRRGGGSVWRVSVTARGMTVCPSAQKTISEITGLERSLSPSHSQKALLTGTVYTVGVHARIEDIARALFASFSAPGVTLLKRPQEARLVMEAHRNPVLAEDLVRNALANMARELRGLPEDTVLEAEVVSLESIHPHDVYALARARLGSLLAEVQGD